MRALPKKPATYADLERLPAQVVGEIVNGELYATPRPTFGHAHVSSALGVEIGGPFARGRGGPGGWWIIDEPELHLGADVLVPDLAGWRKARMPKPPPPSEAFLSLSPDWACEVLSPSTVSLDRVKKKHVYAREGVPHLWFIDPLAKTLEVFRLSEGRWLELGTFEGDEKVRVEPFDAIELELGVLWVPEGPLPR